MLSFPVPPLRILRGRTGNAEAFKFQSLNNLWHTNETNNVKYSDNVKWQIGLAV